jgi:uncharacterized protein YjbJ (UPF0337 family)
MQGKAKKNAGRDSGRPGTEVRGAAKEGKGKARNTVGKARSAAKKASR